MSPASHEQYCASFRQPPKRIVLDTIEALFSALPNPGMLRAEIRRLFGWLKDRGLTTVRATLDVLATSDYLRQGNLKAFRSRALLVHLSPRSAIVLRDPAGTLDYYIGHRRDRLAEVTAALAAGDRTPEQIVARVYRDVDRRLRAFAEWSVRAQLDYLAERGDLPPGVRE